MKKVLGLMLMLGAVAVLQPACHDAPKTQSERIELDDKVDMAIRDMKAADPGLATMLIDRCYGYAVFPNIGKGGVGVGGAYGRGEVFEHGRLVGYTEMTQATIGLQLGGQTYSELICFESKDALERFKNGNTNFAAQASAVAIKSGASSDAKFTDGVAVFTKPKGGLMGEASVGGQKFSFQPL